MTSPEVSFSIWAVCREGFRRNRVPALILQAFAATLLALYFWIPELRPGFEAIGNFKRASGVWFALFSTALFGGMIPWIVMVFRGRIPEGQKIKQLIFFIGFWALQGFMVDWLYTQQNRWFGSANDFETLLMKVLVDQLPYNLLWATPNGIVLYGWKNANFSWCEFKRIHTLPVIVHKYVTIQVSAWVVWVPAVMMIYSLPPDLQVPLFNLVLCFFSLVLAFVSRG